MDLNYIDKMESSKEKLFKWIEYGKKHNCLHDMPEIHELYLRLKREGKVTMQEWNEKIGV